MPLIPSNRPSVQPVWQAPIVNAAVNDGVSLTPGNVVSGVVSPSNPSLARPRPLGPPIDPSRPDAKVYEVSEPDLALHLPPTV